MYVKIIRPELTYNSFSDAFFGEGQYPSQFNTYYNIKSHLIKRAPSFQSLYNMKYEAVKSKQVADPCLKHGYCINGSFSTLKTIRESNPQHLLQEAVIKTYPFENVLKQLNKTCDDVVPLRFRNLTFGQIGYEDDPEYSSLKITDWVETSGDEDKEGVIPYFAFRVAVQDDETMKSEVLKQLTNDARWCGYEVTDARTMQVMQQPFEDCKTCILDVQTEARYTQTPVKLAPTMYHISPARYIIL